VKVEQALRLLPELDALTPLRALLMATSRPDDRVVWARAGEYLTVGKREVTAAELRRQMAQTYTRITEHLSGLYAAYVEAVERLEAGAPGAAVAALLAAAHLEERVGRLSAAGRWVEVAQRLAEGLQDRRPEVDALIAGARIHLALGRYEEGARCYQRALVLAEAEFDQAGAIRACRGLGAVATERGEWAGAEAWYRRALRLAESGNGPGLAAGIHHALGELASRRGDPSGAVEHLRQAREGFEREGDAAGMADALSTQGRVDAELGRGAAAAAAYREALAWARRDADGPGREVAIHLRLAELHLEGGRFLEAEEEIRRAEDVAIASDQAPRLAAIYALLGRSRGLQGDETGFVFFEQAIELARTLDGSQLALAEVYTEYGAFKQRLHHPEEARAYLERAGEIFEALGGKAALDRVRADLHRLSA